MFTWKKLGRLFNPQDHANGDWLHEFAQAPATLVLDDVVRIYFSCRPKPDDNGQYVSYSAFVEVDRHELFKIKRVASKPILELGELGCFDEFGTYPVSVAKEKGNHVVYYGGWTRCESVPFNVAIGKGISFDGGESFKKCGAGPIISYSSDEPFVISGPKIRNFNNQWQLFYIAGKKWLPNNGKPEPVYHIRMATSNDGSNWQKLNKDLIEVRIEEDECQASPDVFYHNNKYHMFFCYRSSLNYRRREGGYRIGYASSDDMINWVRDDSKAGIDISDEGWDDEMISYPHVFELDGKIYMLYLGNSVGRYGFGLAELEGTL